MRTDAEAIFRAGLAAAAPAAAIQKCCRLERQQLRIADHSWDLNGIDRILVVGAGKATASMAQALEQILGERIHTGCISVKYGHTAPLAHIDIIEAGHPVPDANGVRACRRILDVVTTAQSEDLIIGLLSGGGSALLPLPAGNLSLADKQAVTTALLACGATIHEINALRKHLSAIKGGRLALAAAPARMVTLILSDVVGDDLDVIASGPTVPDPSTFGECQEIIRRYGIASRLPQRIRQHIDRGATGRIDETPKHYRQLGDHIHNLIIGSNRQALGACRHEAKRRGYAPLMLSSRLTGETRVVAGVHAAIAREILGTGQPLSPPACLLSGGETTVTLNGNGRGGRNQEFALAAALQIHACPCIVMLSAGTDGTDGPTDAAGAFSDHTTCRRAADAGLDIHRHLSNNDAYPFFQGLNDLLITGPTGTNVMDIHIVLVQPPVASTKKTEGNT
ncbi:MAG: glycerate kinase [Desulfatitalea sp.]|nr:glycerate kinase [Desulfatitalea sp.]NNK00716.1 glycerate kinase [Desulfatitalea sp.]